jgi:hypothetical protein
MAKWISALFLMVLLPTPAGALDYQIKKVPILPIESYPCRVTIGDVTIAADPYGTDEKSFKAFDVKDLNSHGYFPVHILIQNSSKDVVTLRIRNIVLVTAGGQELYSTSATLVVQDVIKGGFTTHLPKMKSRDPATSQRAGSPLLDFTGKELTNRQIDPTTVSEGFLFFFTPEPKKPLFAGAKLRLPDLLDEGSRKPIGPFVIPLDAAEPAARKP